MKDMQWSAVKSCAKYYQLDYSPGPLDPKSEELTTWPSRCIKMEMKTVKKKNNEETHEMTWWKFTVYPWYQEEEQVNR